MSGNGARSNRRRKRRKSKNHSWLARGFRKRDYPEDLQRGLFTLFIDDEKGQHVSQVWASTPGAAASMMAPWSKGRLRRGQRPDEVPVELVGWDFHELGIDLSKASDIPEDELDPGCLGGIELVNVWLAEREIDGRTVSLYVIETMGPGEAMVNEWS